MSDVSIFTHVFDDSYKGVSLDRLYDNLENLLDVCMKRKSNDVSTFSYDDVLFGISVQDEFSFANAINSSTNYQLGTVFYKTLNMLQCTPEMKSIEAFRNYRQGNVHCALWGVNFEPKQNWCLSNSSEEETFYIQTLRNSLSNENFWALKESLFPQLKFIDTVKDAVRCVSGKDFDSIMKDLFLLDNYLSNGNSVDRFAYLNFKSTTLVDISLESETVRNNNRLRSMRTFAIPNLEPVYCELHMKTVNYRTYIYPDKVKKQMWITYIGPHLKTAQY